MMDLHTEMDLLITTGKISIITETANIPVIEEDTAIMVYNYF